MKKKCTRVGCAILLAGSLLGPPLNTNAIAKDKASEKTQQKQKEKDAQEKVTICHKGQTLTVSKSALNAHLNHGDTLGPCDVTPHKNK
jgi:Na+/glutamate symporter